MVGRYGRLGEGEDEGSSLPIDTEGSYYILPTTSVGVVCILGNLL